MDSAVDVVAVLGVGGASVLRTLRAHGSLAVRQTGPATVHLVGTTAGPLGGDLVQIRLRVAAGATLVVRSAAATIALSGPNGGTGHLVLAAEIEDGGLLDCALEPLVVCARADVQARTTVALHGSAQLQLLDQVVLGRHGEDGGHWLGRTAVERDGHPMLRQSTDSTLVAPAGSGIRALVTSVEAVPGRTWTPATSGDAVACPVAAGPLLVSAVGPDLQRTRTDLDDARRQAAQIEPTADRI